MNSLRIAHFAIRGVRKSYLRRLPSWLTHDLRIPPRPGRVLDVATFRDQWDRCGRRVLGLGRLASRLTRELRVPARLGRELDVTAFRDLWACHGRRVLGLVMQVWIVATLVGNLNHATRSAGASYRRGVPLGLPGSSLIRLDAPTVDHYRRLTQALRDRPDTFYSMPGMNSLYFWADRQPPTSQNVTHWMCMLDDHRQRQVVERLEAHPDLCLVVSPSLVGFWMGRRPLPTSPLVRYFEEGFTPSMSVDGIIIKVRKASERLEVADMRRGPRAEGSGGSALGEPRAGGQE